MTLPVDPGQRDDHYRDGPTPEWADNEPHRPPSMDGRGARGTGGFGPGGGGGGGRMGGGGNPFVMKLMDDRLGPWGDQEPGEVALWPAPWIPTSRGAIRYDLVRSFHVDAYEDGEKVMYLVELQLDDGGTETVRGPFTDAETLAAWVDAAFPGASFADSFPSVLGSTTGPGAGASQPAAGSPPAPVEGAASVRAALHWPVARPPSGQPSLPWGAGPR